MKRRFSMNIYMLSTMGILLGFLSFSHTHSIMAQEHPMFHQPGTHERTLNTVFAVQSSQTQPIIEQDHAMSLASNFASNKSGLNAKKKKSWPNRVQNRRKSSDNWDWQAQQDMRSRMTGDGQAWSPVQTTFRKDVSWSSDWELRWWAFRWDNERTVWVYHVRSKATGERYTSFIDSKTGQWHNWQSAR